MQIELKSIKIADLIDGYVNDPDTGVKAIMESWIYAHPISVSSVMMRSNNRL